MTYSLVSYESWHHKGPSLEYLENKDFVKISSTGLVTINPETPLVTGPSTIKIKVEDDNSVGDPSG